MRWPTPECCRPIRQYWDRSRPGPQHPLQRASKRQKPKWESGRPPIRSLLPRWWRRWRPTLLCHRQRCASHACQTQHSRRPTQQPTRSRCQQVNIDIVNPDDLNTAFDGYRFCESNSNIPWLFDDIENALGGQASEGAYPPNADGTASGALTNPLTNSPLVRNFGVHFSSFGPSFES